jgi:shikimate dehydrogenase
MRVLLLGHPVAHSLSPAMQNAAFKAMGMPHLYQALDVAPRALAGAAAELRGDDCLGANVTVPHKLAVMEFVDQLDPLAEATGAVNTIVSRDGVLSGHNTDVEGAWKGLLEPVAGGLGGGRVVVAGAGGGARAVVAALERAVHRVPAQVVVVARDGGHAAAVAEAGARRGLPATSASWSELIPAGLGAGIVINCTPLGLHGEDPFEGVALSGKAVLDLVYAPGGTALVRRARAEGASTALQGDQMLLHQGAAAFRLWTGEDAPLEAMRAALQMVAA